MKKIAILIVFSIINLCFSQNKQINKQIKNQSLEKLKQEINSIIKDKRATVGVAVIFNGKDTLTINNQYLYPTMSVYKFHQVLALSDYMNKNNLPLNTKVTISKKDLLPNTYSPLKKKLEAEKGYKNKDKFSFDISELIEYTVAKSDNITSEILFNYVGGPRKVEDYIRSLGVDEVGIAKTETNMSENKDDQYLNWTRPLAMVRLLEIFLKKDLFAKEYKDFLIKTMIETTTGANKLKVELPKDVIIGHKTGSSYRYEDTGIIVAENDAGFISLPNGNKYTIAVFVMNSYENDEVNPKIIADISKIVYNYAKLNN